MTGFDPRGHIAGCPAQQASLLAWLCGSFGDFCADASQATRGIGLAPPAPVSNRIPMGAKAEIEVILGQWAKAFGAREFDSLAQLYTNDAMYIGPGGLRRGRDAIVEYLHAHWIDATIKFHELNVELLDSDVALAALRGTASYDDAESRGFRFLQTYVWTAKGWLRPSF